MTKNRISIENIASRDASDPLKHLREEFHIPEGLVYLDGNSLGPAPISVFSEIEKVTHQEWATDLIGSWNKAGWFELPVKVGAVIGEIIGAGPIEVVACDTTSINIYKAIHAALSLRPNRHVIVSEGGSFPTDLYMLEGVASTNPLTTIRLEGRDGDTIDELIDEDTAVVLVNHVDYRSGKVRDIGALAELAHEKGAIIVVDLCHSAGIMPVELNRNNIDLAVGCSYKYLNGGPGSPAFLFCANRHLAAVKQPLSGWWGHNAPFAFDQGYRADPGIKKFLCGTQPILSFRAMQAGMELTRNVEIDDIREKSMALTSLFIELVSEFGEAHNVGIASPLDANERGSQVSLTHEDGYEIVQAMIELGVVGDFRTPNIMRFGFAPLYLSYRNVYDAATKLKETLETGLWREERFRQTSMVT